MTIKKRYLSFFVLLCQMVMAQHDSINNLKEVIVSDAKLYLVNKSQSIQILSDSVIHSNPSSLSNLLNYNSLLYFKEYGRGMLSTVSFRGTTASQTAVIWNGININSQLNGSTDFNTIISSDFDSVSIKAGGGSVSYGSGAIGGSVHLSNELQFKNKFENELRLDYGSFNTIGVNYKGSASTKKWSTRIGLSQNSSDNDYPYVDQYSWDGSQRKNENGKYATTNLSAAIAYKIEPNSVFAFYSQTSNTDRNLSLIGEFDSKTKYENSFSRNLLEFTSTKNAISTNYKLAYITEAYRYFENIELNNYTYGKTESFIAKMDIGFKLGDFLKLSGIVDYNYSKGFGSDLMDHSRDISGISLMALEKHNDKWQNELSLRKEVSSDFESPFLFSLGSTYAFNSCYQLKVNLSRNYRIPSFNDLYWETGGNPDLKPELSHQAEIGNVFTYKGFTLTENLYYIKSKNMIRWIPLDGSIWAPENVDQVRSYGSETTLAWSYSIGKNNIGVRGAYAYTVSEDVQTNKQLDYVPYHKVISNISYSYDRLELMYQFLFTGAVSTSSQKYNQVKEYWLSNLGGYYKIGAKNSCKIGLQALNIFNVSYQSISQHYMPGRNFLLNLTLNF